MYKLDETVKQEYQALQQRLQKILQVLENHSAGATSSAVMSKVEDMREFIEEELKSLGNKPRKQMHGRLLLAKGEEERFLSCCRRIQEYMEQLSLDTTLSIWKLEEQQSKEHMSSWVRRLPSSPSAWYKSSAGAELKRRECTPGTRVDVLAHLLGWAIDNSTDTVYWLNGMAGTGKTTIACSMCKELTDNGELAASFFCSRQRQECRDVNLIIPSVAYQLARFSPSFQAALSAVIEKDEDVHHKVLDEQFEALIRKPLLAVLAVGPPVPGRMVVVIDALDECENRDSTRAILNLLLDKAVDLPIKFIVSSRPEPQIREEMTNERVKSRLVLHELDTGNVQTDIKAYLQAELKPMKPPPEEAQIAALVDRAGVLFIYAATVVRYIGYGNFRNAAVRLRTLLNGSRTENTKKNEEIDHLYMMVLDAAIGDQGLEAAEQDDMRQVLYTVICAREPLTVKGLSELLQIKDVERVRAALQPLWSVLHVVGVNELVTTLHASFPDFMVDSVRSKTYHCDSDVHNQTLANHCFELIKRAQPRFNICGLESSYLPDGNVPNIEDRVAKAIPQEL
ncbi:unnamed protein product, partial [Rhizoctonia solani]